MVRSSDIWQLSTVFGKATAGRNQDLPGSGGLGGLQAGLAGSDTGEPASPGCR